MSLQPQAGVDQREVITCEAELAALPVATTANDTTQEVEQEVQPRMERLSPAGPVLTGPIARNIENIDIIYTEMIRGPC